MIGSGDGSMVGINSSQGDTGDTLGADAESSGADATLVKRPRSAPRSSNNFAASTWPFSHAIDSAVRPFATASRDSCCRFAPRKTRFHCPPPSIQSAIQCPIDSLQTRRTREHTVRAPVLTTPSLPRLNITPSTRTTRFTKVEPPYPLITATGRSFTTLFEMPASWHVSTTDVTSL